MADIDALHASGTEEYVQATIPDKRMLAILVQKMRGNRTNKKYAEDTGLSEATISRILNGRITKPLTIEMLERLFAQKEDGCQVEYKELLRADGLVAKVDYEKHADQRHAYHREYMIRRKTIRNIISSELFVRGAQIKNTPLPPPNEIGKEFYHKIFPKDLICDLAINIAADEVNGPWGFVIIPSEHQIDQGAELLGAKVMMIVQRISLILLQDAWAPETMDTKLSFVFSDELVYQTFLDLFSEAPINSCMTAIYVDVTNQIVVSERPMGKNADPGFTSIFDRAPGEDPDDVPFPTLY